MKYVYECEFIDKPDCNKCMLSNERNDKKYCMALGNRPKCPEEGCRKDCPLKEVVFNQICSNN